MRRPPAKFVSWDGVKKGEDEADPHEPQSGEGLHSSTSKEFGSGVQVAFDCNHGSGGTFGPRLLKSSVANSRCKAAYRTGGSSTPPEPTEANLQGLCHAVKRERADVGFAVDPDADRLAFVDMTDVTSARSTRWRWR